jgi:hypothetical protein
MGVEVIRGDRVMDGVVVMFTDARVCVCVGGRGGADAADA